MPQAVAARVLRPAEEGVARVRLHGGTHVATALFLVCPCVLFQSDVIRLHWRVPRDLLILKRKGR
jgi:hypothetical protein